MLGFWGSALKTITIDENAQLASFPAQIFMFCRSLESFILPNNVISISSNSFWECNSLRTFSFGHNTKITTISEDAFYRCGFETFEVPSSVTQIGLNAFSECPNLKYFIFASNIDLKTISGGTFRGCTSLPTITIPKSVESLDPSAFQFCSKLFSINVPIDNSYYSSEEGIVYSKNRDRLVCCPCGKDRAFIKNYIIVIGSNSFYSCSYLLNLTFEDGCRLETIEDGTFYSCTALERVDMPTSLRTVQRSAFLGCSNLAIITFPDCSLCDLESDMIFAECRNLVVFSFGKFCALQHLGNQIFLNCVRLTNITIPANCTSIGDSAFENCESLSNVHFERNSQLHSLSQTSFIGCTSLINYTIPDSFSIISNMCFGGAPNIEIVNVFPDMSYSKISRNSFSSIHLRCFNIGPRTTIDLLEDYCFGNTYIEQFILSTPTKCCKTLNLIKFWTPWRNPDRASLESPSR